MDVNSTLSTVISIFLLLLVGYGAKKVGVLSAKDSPVITSIIVNLALPSWIFTSVHGKKISSDMIKAPFLFIAAEMAVMGLAYMAARVIRLDRRTTGALMLVSVFGNTGFLGYPVVSAAFSHVASAMPTAVMVDQFAMQMMLGIVGVTVAAVFSGSEFECGRLFEFLKTPLFPTAVLALILRNVHVPTMILTTLGYLGAATVPLAMISVGLGLSIGSIKQYPAALVTAVILKMALLPALVVVAMRLVGITGIVNDVSTVLAATPAAVLAGVMAARYGSNGAFAASAIALGTLISVVWIPVVLMLLH
ncbi:MAG: AEC family transporter [Armatimonadota bacterium]|nr:AEC family transporter [bacterium]